MLSSGYFYWVYDGDLLDLVIIESFQDYLTGFWRRQSENLQAHLVFIRLSKRVVSVGFPTCAEIKCNHALFKQYCNKFEILMIFTTFRFGRFYQTNDPFLKDHLTCCLYIILFVLAILKLSNVIQTSHHFSTRVRRHLCRNKRLHIFNHLSKLPNVLCQEMRSSERFSIKV